MEVNEQEEYKREMENLQFDLNLCKTDSERINVLKEHHRNILSSLVAAHNLMDRPDFGWKGFHETTKKSISGTKGCTDPLGYIIRNC